VNAIVQLAYYTIQYTKASQASSIAQLYVYIKNLNTLSWQSLQAECGTNWETGRGT